MNDPYPIITVKTKDKVLLYGLFLDAEKSKTIFIHIHGTAAYFYDSHFIEVLTKLFNEGGISMLSTNNRGAGVYDAWEKTGAAVEKFEDCIFDIDAWVEFALQKGYEQIILAGHSLGTEKVVYYMAKGNFKDRIKALILLAPADSYGSHRLQEGKLNTAREESMNELLKESGDLVEKGAGDIFLSRYAYGAGVDGGIMPKSAESFINFLGSKSELLNALPFATRKLKNYGKIEIPILVVIGDQDEYTAITIKNALDLMKIENPQYTRVHQFINCDHDFSGKEIELGKRALDFIREL